MSLGKDLSKKAIAVIIFATVLGSGKMTVHAQPETNESDMKYGWIESLENGESMVLPYSDGEADWILRSDQDVPTSAGVINLRSYTMTLLNDTKLCKAESKHKSYFHGYVRARFETILGIVVTGSDSGRVDSYWGTTAETPHNAETVGWNGVAHTACGPLDN